MKPTTDDSVVVIGAVQKIRKGVLWIAIAIGIACVLVVASRWDQAHPLHHPIEWVGLVLIVLCILGRTWSTIYIGGQKMRQVVAVGPYSVSRNPLYLFSIIGAAGAGAQLGSVVLAVIAGVVAWLVFLLVVYKEEQVMLDLFGDSYRTYMRGVPRFLPRFGLWRDVETVTIKPSLVLTTFFDALVFLLAIPLAEGIEYLQEIGLLPVLLAVP